MFVIVLLSHLSRIDTGKFGVKNLWRIGIIHDMTRYLYFLEAQNIVEGCQKYFQGQPARPAPGQGPFISAQYG